MAPSMTARHTAKCQGQELIKIRLTDGACMLYSHGLNLFLWEKGDQSRHKYLTLQIIHSDAHLILPNSTKNI